MRLNPPKIEVVWEDPPEVVPPALQLLLDALAMLKTKPDTWARVGEWEASSGAYAARKRLLRSDSVPGNFEYRVVNNYGPEKTGSALYARYLARQ